MDRKEFLKTCGLVSLSGAALSAFLQSCASGNYFAQSSLSNQQLVIKKSEFIKLEKGKTVKRKYVLAKSDQFNFPIYISKSAKEDYTALLMQCTHKGCELQPQGDYLMCPCHGSEFTNKGLVQNPPAEDNLHNFKVTSDHENIYIQL